MIPIKTITADWKKKRRANRLKNKLKNKGANGGRNVSRLVTPRPIAGHMRRSV